MTAGSEISTVVEDALRQVRLAVDREIEMQTPPFVLDYTIEPKLIADSVRESARALPPDAPDPITLTISNVEVELDEDDDPSPFQAGKYLGLTFRWPSTGIELRVPPSLQALLSESGSFAYAVDRNGEASVTVLLRDFANAMTWDPDTYPTTIRAEIHDYDELQDQVVEATTGISVQSILELGVGTGETASRVLRIHPDARLVGIDSSAEMLRRAADFLPRDRVTLLQQDLNEPLPDERFDLVISALAIHHLESDGKAKLFREISKHLEPGGRFVMADVVVPKDPSEALIENEPGYDFPSTVEDQLRWMSEAGFSTEVTWTCMDLAVLKAHLRVA